MGFEVINGDCLVEMPKLIERGVKARFVFADPPYGCGKAEWDTSFPTAWYSFAKRLAPSVCIITGSAGLKDSIPLVGCDFVDVISARNLNGMTRGPIGFGNWLAAVVAGEKPRMGPNAFDFVVSGEQPPHPSPKALEYMRRLVCRLTEPGDLIVDPFAGSFRTGEACVLEGRDFIGIELNPDDCRYGEAKLKRALGIPADIPRLNRRQIETPLFPGGAA